MSAEAIAAIGAIQEPSLVPSTVATSGATTPEASGFSSLVTDGIGKVNEQLMTGQVQLQQLAAGEPVNLHQVMIGLEESRMSFQLLMQVRNRLLEGYQEVMRMQL